MSASASPVQVVGLLAFAAPHAELGEAVGVAAVCERGATVSLAALRRAGGRGGALSRRWLPEAMPILGRWLPEAMPI